MSASESRRSQYCRNFAQTVSVVAVAAGGLALAGWQLNVAVLTSILPGAATMKPGTALCFILAGVSLALLRADTVTTLRRRTAWACAFLVALFGALTLVEYVFHWDLGIDAPLFRAALVATGDQFPGRMAPATSIGFLTLGGSLLSVDRSSRHGLRLFQGLASITAVLGLVALLGYIYSVRTLYQFFAYSSVALPTAFVFTLLGLGAIASRPSQGLMVAITSDLLGGWMIRRLLPATILVPFTLASLRLAGERAGYYGMEVGLALFATANVVVLAIVVWLGARSLNRLDRERRRTGNALRKSEELFSKSFHSNPAAMVLQRLRDLSFVDVNRSWLKLTGYERDEVLGRTPIDLGLISSETVEAVEKGLNAAGGGAGVQLSLKTKQGDVRRILLTARAVMVDSEQHGLSVLLDITDRERAEAERSRLEAQIRQSQKLQALGTLAAGIAHDFNNILTVIVGNTELARRQLPAEDPVRASIEQVHTAGVRASELVRQILSFGRQQDAKPRVVKLQSIVEDCCKLLRPILPQRIEIRRSFDPALPDVSADSTQIHQVILNLGANAAHAMGEAGGLLELHLVSMFVSPELALVSADLHEGHYVRLAIRDNGCGMDPEVMQRIFDPFFTTKEQGEGTGLGLAVVHGIMKGHGGAVTVYSEPGKGTAFHLYFPAAGEAAVDAPPPAREIGGGDGEHVLYIDDEGPMVFLITRLLERFGYRVTGTTDAVQALQMFRSRPDDFDAVVTDLNMPGMPGIELVRRIRQIRPDIPVVMTSGYIREEDIASAQRLGVTDLILKPDTVEELGQTLRKLLSRRA